MVDLSDPLLFNTAQFHALHQSSEDSSEENGDGENRTS